MKRILLAAAFLALAALAHGQSHPFETKLPLIDRYIDSVMKAWNIPGLAIGIVYKDQLVYGKGYGYRDLEKKLPVETTTMFPIASNTKLFTATAACMLAAEGKLDLDKPVRNYVPSLSFHDDLLNSSATLRDLLSHRTGLPRYDGIWIASPLTRSEIAATIAYMKPQLGFREGYLYNNMMYSVAGLAMERVAGMSWEEIIRKKIFEPLEMTASGFSQEDMTRSGNFAFAYFETDSTRRLKTRNVRLESQALGPAGTIKSNVEEMSRWMITQLNGGKYRGRQVIPEPVIRQTLIPNTIADKEGRWSELSNALYALGRNVLTYKGYKISTHTGSIDGFYSNLTFVFSENIAVFMVHNSTTAASFRSGMAFPVIDRLLNLTLTPWSERYLLDAVKNQLDDKKRRDSIRATQKMNTVPSQPLHLYAGQYLNPVYGEITIDFHDGKLWLNFRGQRSALGHFHYDQFVTNEAASGLADFRLNFLTNSDGKIDRLACQPYGDPLAEFVKRKR